MNQKNTKNKLVAVLLALGLTLSGCAQNDASEAAASPDAPLAQSGTEASTSQDDDMVQIGTGRIVEQDITPEGFNANSRIQDIYSLPDGTLVLMENDGEGNRRVHYTSDYGESWAQYDNTAFTRFMQEREYNMYKHAVDQNGAWWVGIQDNDGLRLYRLDGDEVVEIDLAGWVVGTAADAYAATLIPVESGMLLGVQSTAAMAMSFCIIGWDGSLGEIFTPSLYPSPYSYAGGRMYCALSGEPQIEVYDTTTGELVQLVEMDLPVNEAGSYLPFVMAAREDGTLLYTDTNGIHSLNPDGTPGEDVANTRAFSYAWPGFFAHGMLAMADGSLVVNGYTGSAMRLLRYWYDAEMPVYESQTLRVWTLESTTVLEAAAFAFMKRHPEYEVDIEIGRTEESGAFNDEDIIRELNLRILGGDPPDVLVLDGLNAASFIKAGALQDISGIVDKNDYYPGIIESYSHEGVNYAYPALFLPPVLVMDETDAGRGQASVMSLENLAELCTDTDAIDPDNYSDLFNSLYNAYSPRIFPGGDTVDEEALTGFMAAIDTIANAQGLTEPAPDSLYDSSVINGRVIASESGYQNFRYAAAGSAPRFALGTPTYNFDIAGMYVSRGDVEVLPLPGGGFVPVCTAAVPTGAAQGQAAGWFIAAMLEDENVQRIGNDTLYGFSVKRGLIATQFEETRQRFTDTGDPDIEIKGDIMARDWDRLWEAYTAPSVTDVVLRQRVYEAVARLCEGAASLDTATSEVLQSTSLYFAERVA